MKDILLSFPDEATAISLFEQVGMYQNGGYIQYTHDYALDLIGYIPSINNSGWCANLRMLNDDIDTSIFDAYTVNPSSPYRVWA